MPIILRWKLDKALLCLLIVFGVQTVGLHVALANSITGSTGIVYTEGINPDSNKDVHMTGGGSYSIWCWLDGVVVGAISYTGDSWVQKNCAGINSEISDGNWTFSTSATEDTKTEGEFYSLNGSISEYNTPTFNVGNNSGNQNTRFISASIVGTTTNPKNVFVTVQYFLDPAEINRSISSKNPTQISLSVAKKPATTFSKYSFTIPTTLGTSTQTFTLLDSDLADSGIFDLLIQFSNSGVPFGSDIPFEDSYIYTAFTLDTKLVSATSSIENYNSQTITGTTITSQPCGITALSGCINNAFGYLFIPTPTKIGEFQNIPTTLSTKFPFAYIYDFQNSITDLYTESNTQNDTLTIPFATYGNITLISKSQIASVPFADWIKITLGYILWIMFGLQMYKRTLLIFNPKTT